MGKKLFILILSVFLVSTLKTVNLKAHDSKDPSVFSQVYSCARDKKFSGVMGPTKFEVYLGVSTETDPNNEGRESQLLLEFDFPSSGGTVVTVKQMFKAKMFNLFRGSQNTNSKVIGSIVKTANFPDLVVGGDRADTVLKASFVGFSYNCCDLGSLVGPASCK